MTGVTAVLLASLLGGCATNKSPDPYVDGGIGGFNRTEWERQQREREAEEQRLRAATDALTREVGVARQRNARLERRLAEADAELAAAASPAKEKRERIAALQRERQALEAELDGLQRDNTTQLEQRQKRIAELKRRNDELWDAAMAAVAP